MTEGNNIIELTSVEERFAPLTGEVYTGLPEAPIPLVSPLLEPSRFPIVALGQILGEAAEAIADIVQCSEAIAGQSVLAAASLAAQAHADVQMPVGRPRPLSLFAVTVASSGERKSAADSEALWPIRKHEQNLRDQYNLEYSDYAAAKSAYDGAKKKAENKANYEAIRQALSDLPNAPEAPLKPLLAASEPTLEGMYKLLAEGPPAQGVFADEGGSFLGGHAMGADARLRTMTGLSSLWDGSVIKRVRAGDGITILPGRRLAMHLMLQPLIAREMIGDEMMRDQGFLSRILITAPSEVSGTRFHAEPKPSSRPLIERYGACLLQLLEKPWPVRENTRQELEPKTLVFSSEAKARWIEFYNDIEATLGPDGKLRAIKGLGNKIPEHASRIAGVLMLVRDPDATEIRLEELESGIELARHYVKEALRLRNARPVNPDVMDADKLLHWLHHSWDENHVSIREITTRGPTVIRDKVLAERAVKRLEDHKWLIPAGPEATVRGVKPHKAWRIVTDAKY